jgi:predicted nucleotidyltransferase
MSVDPILSDQRLAEAVRRLRDAYAPDRIYLFGSKARGDDGPDSDYDLLIVVPDSVAPEARASKIGCRALRGTGIAADVVVCTHGYFEARVHLQASLPGIVLREGRVLHAA